MARPQKNNVDYFSHDSGMRNDRRVKALRSKYGLEGYAVWNMFLETLAGCDYFKITIDEVELELLAGDFGVTPDRLKEILDFLVDHLKILQREGENYWCEKLNERLEIVFEKRDKLRNFAQNRERSGGKFIKKEYQTSGENHQASGQSSGENTRSSGISADETPQSKLKEIKLNKIKENIYTPLNPPEGEILVENPNIPIIDSAILETFGQNKQWTSGARAKLRARLKVFTAQEIADAFRNLLHEPDRWKLDNNGHRPLAWWLHSDERILEMQNCHLKKSTPQSGGLALIGFRK